MSVNVPYSLQLCYVSGCLLAVEAIPLHFTFFSKLWMEVYQKAGDVRVFFFVFFFCFFVVVFLQHRISVHILRVGFLC